MRDWECMPSEQFCVLKRVSLELSACFCSAYVSESVGSTADKVKSNCESSRADTHVNDCMTVAAAKHLTVAS